MRAFAQKNSPHTSVLCSLCCIYDFEVYRLHWSLCLVSELVVGVLALTGICMS